MNAWTRWYCSTLAGLVAPLVLTTAAGQPPPAPDRAAAERQAALNKLPDSPGTGRFPALKQEVASLPDHVVYRPADLGKLGAVKLGLYIFGNGACANDGASARLHLLEIASHGYLAIAPGRIRSGPGAVKPADEPPAPAACLPHR